MNKRFKIGLAVLLIALAVVILSLVLGQHEPDPIIEGRPLSQWLAEYHTGMDLQARARVDEILRKSGTNSFPFLLRMLSRRDSALKLALMLPARRQHFIRTHFVSAQEWHYRAGIAFAGLGAAGRDAIPALIQLYDEDISSSSRFWIVNALGSMGPAASNAVPFLLCAATNAVKEVRLSSITTLQQINARPDLTLPALINSLSDQDFMVRYYATLALGKLGGEAKEAIPALTNLLRDPDHNVRQGAAGALISIEHGARATN